MLVRRRVMVRGMHRVWIIDITIIRILGGSVMVHHGWGSVSVVLISGGGGSC